MKKPNGGVDILGGYFTVYPSGDVWSNKTHQFVGGVSSGNRYKRISFGKKHLYVHRLVAHAFLGLELDSRLTVDHIDGNTLNNGVTNLRIVSRGVNSTLAKTKRLEIPVEDVIYMVIAAKQWESVAISMGFSSGYALKSHLRDTKGFDTDEIDAQIGRIVNPKIVRETYTLSDLESLISELGSKSAVARKLGISRTSLSRIMVEKS